MQPRIWSSGLGFGEVLILTATEFGHGFFDDNDLPALRESVAAGRPLTELLGLSGTVIALRQIRRVEMAENVQTLRIVARDFLGKAKETFTFSKASHKRDVFASLRDALGPEWTTKTVAHGRVRASVLPVLFILFMAPIISFGVVATVFGEQTAGAKVDGSKIWSNPLAIATLVALGLATVGGGVIWLVRRWRNPPVTTVLTPR